MQRFQVVFHAGIIIQIPYTVRIPIFWLADLYHMILGWDETTSLIPLSWCNSRDVSSTHHYHYIIYISYIIVCYPLIVNSYASVHIERNVWTSCNIIKQFFSTHYLTFFFLFMQWDCGKFIPKQLDYSPSFSTSDSQLACATLTICS